MAHHDHHHKLSLKSLLHHDHHKEEKEHPLAMSDEHILELIYSTHVHSDTKFEVDPLFTLVHNTLSRSTIIVEDLVQGSKSSMEEIDEKIPQANFCSPYCTLKQISYEMCCKAPGELTAHETAVAILHKLSHYEWDAKAVLTFAAFSVEYGEFWLLSQHLQTDVLAKSLAVMKRVPLLIRPANVQKHREAIAEVNNLVKATLQVIELIFELEKLSSYDTKDVPALLPAREHIPVDVYWCIITLAAIVTQIECLITDSEEKQELYHYGQKINVILSKLRKQITLCRLQIEEAEYYRKLRKLFQTPTEIMEVFKALIFAKDAPQPLFDCSTETTVDITVLKKKHVYLFISTLEITEEEISVLRPVHEYIKSEEEYKIVWVPIVEEWTEHLRKKFEVLKAKMKWFVVQHFGSIAGYKYIKEEWQFKKSPMVVVLNPQGKVLHQNAFHLIEAYGMKAFPFTTVQQEIIHKEKHWVGSVVGGIHSNVDIWMKEEKYIMFYGGKDKEWIQEFSRSAASLANETMIKELKISIELFCVEKENRNVFKRFWKKVESLFVTKAHKAEDAVKKEVQRLLCYKDEIGWALLSKGSSVVVSGHGSTMLKAVTEFERWKEVVVKKGFELSFKEYHERVASETHRCAQFEIPDVAGKLPEAMNCPDCPRVMDIFITYKCCHNDDTSTTINDANSTYY
ncbi:hypothetical protein PIB30_022194 [Stylosanthes scabra]|uniref:Protein SIEVE ELEMENT OCCLUSION B n=1 Tax=Stylosanthes scabra TaxID=79078 RepID=A0ABU6X7B3_9FABA|nr:hypothetical protein [Stylosanthes scabra]